MRDVCVRGYVCELLLCSASLQPAAAIVHQRCRAACTKMCGKWKMHLEIRTLNFTHCLRFIALVAFVSLVLFSLLLLLLLPLLLRVGVAAPL